MARCIAEQIGAVPLTAVNRHPDNHAAAWLQTAFAALVRPTRHRQTGRAACGQAFRYGPTREQGRRRRTRTAQPTADRTAPCCGWRRCVRDAAWARTVPWAGESLAANPASNETYESMERHRFIAAICNRWSVEDATAIEDAVRIERMFQPPHRQQFVRAARQMQP